MRHEHWEERLVHYQYIEDLLEGARVLEVGCGSGAGAHFLARRALQVISIDPSTSALDNSRYAYSQPNLTFMRTEPANFQIKDHSFDLVLVPELKRFSTWGAFMPEVRRVLKPEGKALFAVTNGDQGAEGMALAEFEEYLSHTFAHLRLMGEIPFDGITVADFNPEGEVAPLLDCSLVPEDVAPKTYLAICCGEPLASLGYGVLQVPGREDGEASQLQAELDQTRKELAELQQRKERRVGGRSSLAGRLPDLEAHVLRESKRSDDLEQQLQGERQRLDRERDRSEAAAHKYLEEKGRAETERVRAAAAERALTECRQSMALHAKRAESAERRCDTLLMRIEQGSADLSRLHQRIAELQGLRQADQWRVDELVGRLREAEERAAAMPPQRDTTRTPTVDTNDVELAKQLDDAAERVEQLEAEILKLREHEDSAVGQLQKRLSEAKERARAVERKLAEYHDEQEQAEQQASDSSEGIQQLQQKLQQALEEQARLEKELMKSESRVAEHQRKATSAESRVTQLEVRLKRSESEAATLSKWAEELRDELAESHGKSRALPVTPEPEVTALRNDLRQANARVSTLEQRCGALREELQSARQILRTREATATNTAATSDQAELARVRARQLAAMEQGAAAHRRQMAQCQARRAELEALCEELQARADELDRDLASCRRQRQQASTVQQRLDDQNRQLSRELARAQGALKRSRAELARAEEAQQAAPPAPPAAARPVTPPAAPPQADAAAPEPPPTESLDQELEQADHRLDQLDRQLSRMDSASQTVDGLGSRLEAEVKRLSDLARALDQLPMIKDPTERD